MNKKKLLTISNFNKIIPANSIALANNLTFYSQAIYDVDKSFSGNIFLWSDGIGALLTDPFSKRIHGRDYLRTVISQTKLIQQEILFIGSDFVDKNNILHDLKFKKIILPFAPVKELWSDLKEQLKKFSDFEKYIIIITLPSPKQEYIAFKISNMYDVTRIYCFGGALEIILGIQPESSKMIYLLGLEWLWRLRQDTFRRLKRLIKGFYGLIPGLIYFKRNFYK